MSPREPGTGPEPGPTGFDRVRSTRSSEARAPQDSGDPIDHLWGAAHEFLAAFRAVIDAADAVVLDQQRKVAAPRPPRLRRIDVE